MPAASTKCIQQEKVKTHFLSYNGKKKKSKRIRIARNRSDYIVLTIKKIVSLLGTFYHRTDLAPDEDY